MSRVSNLLFIFEGGTKKSPGTGFRGFLPVRASAVTPAASAMRCAADRSDAPAVNAADRTGVDAAHPRAAAKPARGTRGAYNRAGA